jgi:CheY-like chemotaxis protein
MADDRPGTPAVDARAQPESEPRASPASDRRAILIVERDRAEVERIASILGEAGHVVLKATSGRAALRLVVDSTSGPALLICAIEMPEMSGIELAARLTALRPSVRVVLMATDPQSVERAHDRLTLVHGVLLKPFTPDALREAAAAALTADL